MGSSSYHDLYALLDSVRSSYPRGVPQRVIKECATKEIATEEIEQARRVPPLTRTGAAVSGIAFLGGWALGEGDRGNLFSGSEGALLQAAVERGLKVLLNNVLLLHRDGLEKGALEGAVLWESVLRELQALPADVKVIICLGVPIDPQTIGGRNAISTHPLSAIVTDEQKKREFWGALKQALAGVR